MHDASDEAAGELLKDLVEARPPDAEVYRLALLYYGRRYERLTRGPNRTLEQDYYLDRLKETLVKLAPLYRQYHGQAPDAEVFPYLEMVDRSTRAGVSP